ncbi:HAD family hydrolase [Longispora sp. K20-0274]|uniref:HAD family hydrolase n=1 Tax=Longispora sp. K20-0274 TaxID=3088255 RepID=UPI00399AA81C
MTRPRLAAVDLDGTLLRSDHSISERTVRAVAEARAAGVEIVFVTTRHPAAVLDYAVQLDLVGEAVCCTGAAICALPGGEVTWSSPMDPTTTGQAAKLLRAAYPDVGLGWALERGPLGYDARYTAPALIGEGYRGEPDDVTEPVLTMWALSAGIDGSWPAGFAESAEGVVDVTHRGTGVLYVAAPGVTKVRTLRELCARRGITAAEVVAFGDTHADLDMLRWAGHGVIMANAVPELHAEADEAAPGCDEDGVAVVLERLVRA